MIKKIFLIIALAVVIAGGYFGYSRQQNKATTQPPTKQSNPANQNSGFNKTRYSLTDPTSIWVIVNKKNALPDGYKPADLVVPAVKLRLGAGAEQMQLRAEAAQALEALFLAAKNEGYELMLGSGFRSFALQKSFYDGYVAKDGQAAADTYSARPGHSEHQTGLGVDIDRFDQKCHLQECFGDLPEGQWLATHAHEHGFVLRYYNGKQDITGYIYEPWHFRYVGKELAAEVYKSSLTLEEFFNLPPAATY